MIDERRPRAAAPVLAVALVVLAGIVVAISVTFNRVAGPDSPPGVPTAPALAGTTPGATPSPTPTPAPQVAFADCSTQSFGAPLAPASPPTDPHLYPAPPPTTIEPTRLYLLTITTARGVMTACLQPELAPTTVNVVVSLARNHFYDGLTFHRVVADFVIQGGDPKGDGSGGPGFSFADEPVRQQYVAGALAMANSGANTNGSQFFICTVDDTTKLKPAYNLFGRLQTGLDVAAKIAQGDVITTVRVAESTS